MFKKSQWLTLYLVISFNSFAAEGLINVFSQHSFEDTANKLEEVLRDNGMKVFSRVPHSSDALKTGIELPSTELIIFGNPKVGSKLMQCAQTVAIDLPLKALVWQDKDNKVWISYNDPEYLKKRHHMEGCGMQLKNVSGALNKLTSAAAN